MIKFVIGIPVGVALALFAVPGFALMVILWILTHPKQFEAKARDIGSTYTESIRNVLRVDTPRISTDVQDPPTGGASRGTDPDSADAGDQHHLTPNQ